MLKGLYEYVQQNGGFKWENMGDSYILYAAGVKTNIKINVYKNKDSYDQVTFEYEVVLHDFAKSYGSLGSAKKFGSKDLFMRCGELSEDIKFNGKSLADGKVWEL